MLYFNKEKMFSKRQTRCKAGAQSHASFVVYKERQTAEDTGDLYFESQAKLPGIFLCMFGLYHA
jgi:hypothetical protein